MEFGAMAQRSSGFARNPVSAAEAIAATATLARAMEDGESAVALELAPLIAPYRKHGRLSLRVERLPHRARLSRGHNNGDRSWSLMSDELDGLTYLPPKGPAQSCTLGIRIVSLDAGDGTTLALLDYPVAAEGAVAPAAPRHAPEVDQAELRRLRDELARTKAQAAEQENSFRAARGTWESDLQAQLAASSALANDALERQRAAWEQAPKTQPRPADMSAEIRRQIEAALAKAEKEWKAGEAERLARAEAGWEARAAKALSEAGAQIEKARTRSAAETAREKSDEAERRRLRDELARLKKLLGAKESEFSETRESARKMAEEALAGAEQAWREREAQNLSAARAQWQERSERALAEATAQFERAEAARAKAGASRLKDAEAELEALKDDLAHANEILADRENDIADMQARLDEAADRTPAIETREAEIERLKSDLAGVRGVVAERERDIVEARAQMERARQDWQRQSEARFAEALAEWKKGEAARLIAAEAQSQEQAQGQLTRMAQRLKQVEGELKEARAQAEALRQRGDAEDVKKLRREFGHLQSALAERETEIAQLRLDGEHARERWTADARMSLQNAEHQWKAEAENAEERKLQRQGLKRTARDVALVASVSVIAVMLYLHFDLGALINLFPPLAAIVETTPAPPAPQPVQAAKPNPAASALPLAVVVRSANVRATPSKTADVIATLPRDSAVAVLEHHGNWVRVKITGANKNREGWVYTTYLKDKPVMPQKHG
jgi:colicin import membrane protein